MSKDFWASVWAWLITPWDEPTGEHRPPQTLEGGRYKGKHRLRSERAGKSRLDTPEAGAWFRSRRTGPAARDASAVWLAQHRADFAQAYARAQGRVA